MSRLHWIESGKLVVQHGHLWYYILVPMSLVLLLTGIIFSQVFHPFIQLYEVFQTSTKLDTSILLELKDLAIRSIALMLPYILISSLLIFVAFLSLIRAIYAVYLNKKFIFKQNIKRTLLDIVPGLVLLILLVMVVVVNIQRLQCRSSPGDMVDRCNNDSNTWLGNHIMLVIQFSFFYY